MEERNERNGKKERKHTGREPRKANYRTVQFKKCSRYARRIKGACKHTWMQIFDELKTRGVEDILFICIDGVSGLEDGAKAIFKDVVVQRCIVHLIRNSIKYVPSKDYKKFTQSIKKVYGAPSLTASRKAYEQFCQEWSQYPGAVDA